MEKSTPLWCEDCRFFSFETGLGKPMLTLNDPNGLKNSTNVYSIHLELRMALPCQISAGKWKYVDRDLDFLGIPDQRTAYVKRQARPGWTYVRRSSVTLDLFIAENCKQHSDGGSRRLIWLLTYWRQNGRNFADDIFKHIFSNENCCILIQIHFIEIYYQGTN